MAITKKLISKDEYDVIETTLNIDAVVYFIMKSNNVNEEVAKQTVREILSSPKIRQELELPCRFCERKIPITKVFEHECNELDIIMKMHTDGDSGVMDLIYENAELISKRFPLDKRDLNKKVYRGLNFKTQKELLLFISSIELGQLQIDKYSSWSFDYYTAESFALFGNNDYKSESDKNYFKKIAKKSENTFGIVLSTVLIDTKSVLAKVDKNFGAYDEEEVLLNKGVYNTKIENIYNKN